MTIAAKYNDAVKKHLKTFSLEELSEKNGDEYLAVIRWFYN
jgi:hypothetical protein